MAAAAVTIQREVRHAVVLMILMVVEPCVSLARREQWSIGSRFQGQSLFVSLKGRGGVGFGFGFRLDFGFGVGPPSVPSSSLHLA